MDARKQTIPTVLVVLGVTGDLMAKKIVPALFNLHEKKMLPPKFRLVGVSRRDWHDDELRRHIRTILDVKIPDAKASSVKSFLNLATYHRLTFTELDDYRTLYDRLKAIDDEWGVCTNKLFYLSVPPRFYEPIFTRLHKSRLTDGCSPEEGWTRVIVEKPFGSDEKSAKALDAQLARLFKEEQIYRIDHYLAKETFQNIIVFRFFNNLFRKEWNNGLIERIHIREWENIGAEDRGAFYDAVGALRDVGQNHLLQMLALVAMDEPEDMNAAAIRRARAAILETLVKPSLPDIRRDTFRAQYEGYRSIKGVSPRSTTETYFRVKGFLSHPGWRGVPIVMEAGKRMLGKKEGEVTEIEVIFRHPEPCLCPSGKHFKNSVVFRQDPAEGITVHFWVKKPGFSMEIEERTFELAVRERDHAQQYTEEYEKLLLDCIAGDQTLFVSSEEIVAMWRFVDPILAAWDKGAVPLRRYAPDSPAVSAVAAVRAETVEKAKRVAPREIGIFGLGKMGANVARALREKGWRVVVANRSPAPVAVLAAEGFETASSPGNLARALKPPRVIWLMITAGRGVDDFLFGRNGIVKGLKRGDIVIDAGNSFYEDTVRRAKRLARNGIHLVDVGFSGGPRGARRGGSLMVGGDRRTFEYLEPLFRGLAVPLGYARMGDTGAGHFVKMVHNGIEYGMMQSLAEGFALMKRSPFNLDLEQVARVYNHGSVIESRLDGWLEDAFRVFGKDLKEVSGRVAATGEGEWTVKTARRWRMKLPAITDAFKFRTTSQKKPSYMGKILSALRNRFGGHKA